jgi:aryl-alcohol dehydrogenase-like predicted oxidoreductase
MQRRTLGELEVSAVGLGCATMTPFYDEPDKDAAIDTLRHAREIGVDFLDSSDAYGQGRNEELIACAVKGHRDEHVIASKFGNLRAPDGSPTSDGRSEYVKACCERSLKRLEIDAQGNTSRAAPCRAARPAAQPPARTARSLQPCRLDAARRGLR